MKTPGKRKPAREKRKYTRKPCSTPVGYAVLDTDHTAVIENISSGGVFIDSENALDVGRDILMTIQFPEEPKPVTLIGEVVWNNHKGMGIRFKMGFDSGLIPFLMNYEE